MKHLGIFWKKILLVTAEVKEKALEIDQKENK